MSTSPEQVLQALSWFLAGRTEVEQLEDALADAGDLGPESAALVQELRAELSRPGRTRSKLQPLVRETIEAIAQGV